ncbi:MAG: acyl carrier protein [Candidatus Glassbacteria bacterium]|nr:acyl carrier protein [Candidatus Glassbacteria bacterium]
MKDKVMETIAAILNLTPGKLGENVSAESLEDWDSINHMKIMIALEEEFGIELSDDEMMEMVSMDRILEVLNGRK